MPGDASIFPFRANKEIKDRFGVDALRQIAANLWPRDCQTCGRPFGDEVPALVVNDIAVLVAASLHHTRCQAPGWNEGLVGITTQFHLSHNTQTALIPTEVDGRPDPMPAALLNPSLEQVILRKEPQWSVATVSQFRDQCGLTGIDGRQPVPDAFAQFQPDGLLRVGLERISQSWEFDVSQPPELRPAILRRRGIALGVTTAYVPGEDFVTLGDFADAFQSGQMAFGWITLRS
ncbi:hypothetical protein [Nocardia salmonicida]|uniref:hypothetical protein n=1 Tax=Nocardia salmonicida TaxID=53431 RepID=UPI0037970F2B